MRQYNSSSANSCASPLLLCDYCRLQPQQPSNAAQCHTQQHSNTATLTTTRCCQRRSESNTSETPKQRSAAATHTTTLHTQRARRHGKNTQRQRGSAHQPTTASSSVQRSNSRRHTLHFHHGVAVAVGSYTTAMQQTPHRTRVALVRRTDCQRPPQPPTTHAQRSTAPPVQCGGNTRVCAAQRDAHTRAINHRNNRTQRCAVTQQPQRETRCSNAHATTPSRNRNTVASTHCARDSAGSARPRRASYIARMTQPRCFTFSQAQRLPHAPTSAALPATITPQTCARRHTR
jgi:hypothetical protein